MCADKYDDPVGLVLPPETQPYLDTWKRPEELVQNMPNIPVVMTKAAAAAADAKGQQQRACTCMPAYKHMQHNYAQHSSQYCTMRQATQVWGGSQQDGKRGAGWHSACIIACMCGCALKLHSLCHHV